MLKVGSRLQLLRKPPLTAKYLNPAHPSNHGLYWWFIYNEFLSKTAYDKTGKPLQSIAVYGVYSPYRIFLPSFSYGSKFAIAPDFAVYMTAVELNYYQRWTLPDIPSVGDFTLVWAGHHWCTSGYQPIFAWVDSSSYNQYLLLYGFHASTNTARVSARMNGGSDVSCTFDWTYQGGFAEIAIVRRGSNIEFYKDAVALQAPVASVSTATTFVNGNLSCEKVIDRYGYSDCQGIQFFTRALTQDQIANLFEEPYGTVDNPRLLMGRYRRRYAIVTRQSDFWPILSRFLG